MDNKSRKLVLVGYSDESKAYRLLDVTTSQIIISRDVRFIEDEHGIPTEVMIQSPSNTNGETLNEVDFCDLLDSDTEIEKVTVNPNVVNENEVHEVPNSSTSQRSTKGIPPERFKANKIIFEISDRRHTKKLCHVM